MSNTDSFTPPIADQHCDYWVERVYPGTFTNNYQCLTSAQYNAEFNAPFKPGPEYWPQFYVGLLFLSLAVAVFVIGSVVLLRGDRR
jgi:hypothetical protein